MSSIFISHSSADDEVAARVRDALEAAGHHSLFLDFDPEHGIPAGRDWEKELYAQLRACHACVVLCSEHFNRSAWCFAEVTHARALGKAVFPVKVSACEIHSLLRTPQVIDLTSNPDEGFARLRRGLLAAGLDPSNVFEWDSRRPPYPGLSALDERDAAVFFGREREIRDALDVVNRQRRFGAAGLVLFIGASGSGKSSLVRAGVLPRLRRNPARWLIVPPFRPLDRPSETLASALSDAFAACKRPRDWRAIRDELAVPDAGARLAELARELRLDAGSPEATALLVVDQLEEVFGPFARDPAGRFLSMLRSAAVAPGRPVMILATLRSDFLAALQTDPATRDVAIGEKVLVNPIPMSSLGEVIEKPASVAGLQLEEGLAQAILQDTATPDALPLLAFALREQWERRERDGRLTLAGYREIRGVTGSIARAAEDLVKGVSPADEQELRRAFLAMLRVDDRGHVVRQPVSTAPLAPRVVELVEPFVHARLLVARGEGDGRMLELAHEALLHEWKRLARWIDEARASLQWRKRLDDAIREWVDAGKSVDRLLTGVRLREADARVRSGAERLTAEQLDFVRASIAADRRRGRVQKAIAAGAAAAVVLAGLYSLVKGIEARESADRARTHALISSVRSVLSTDPLAASLILAELPRGELPWETLAVALGVARESQPWSVLAGGKCAAFSVDGERVVTVSLGGRIRVWRTDGRGEPLVLATSVSAAECWSSPDGRRVATVGYDGTARVWSTENKGEPVVLEGRAGRIASVAFSPDGRSIVTGHEDGTARVWSADGKGEPEALPSRAGPILSVASRRDGTVVTGHKDGTVRVWHTSEPLVLKGHTGAVTRIAFTGDGERVLTVSDDGTARVWSADAGRESLVLGGGARITSAAFSRDGDRVVTVSADGAVRVWSADGASKPVVLKHGASSARSAAFSSDGRRIVTAYYDGTARVWSADGGGEPVVLRGPARMVTSAGFSVNGRRVVTTSDDETRVWSAERQGAAVLHPGAPNTGTLKIAAFSADRHRVVTAFEGNAARLWNVDGCPGEPLLLEGDAPLVESAAFSDDGRRVITGHSDGTALVWSAEFPSDPVVLEGHAGEVTSVAFGRDGRVITASKDGTAVIRSLDRSDEPVVLKADAGEVMSAAFDPDFRRVVTGHRDGTVRLWRADGDGKPMVLRDSAWPVTNVAMSRDGHVLTVSDDGTVRVRSADGRGEPVVLGKHEHAVSVAFSSDARRVVTAHEDGTVRVWSADGRGEPVVLESDGRPVVNAAFSPDDRRVVAISDDQTVRAWRVVARDVLDDLAQQTTACLTLHERVQYLGERQDEARAHFAACEARFGRPPPGR